jgi:hypothetical protein
MSSLADRRATRLPRFSRVWVRVLSTVKSCFGELNCLENTQPGLCAWPLRGRPGTHFFRGEQRVGKCGGAIAGRRWQALGCLLFSPTTKKIATGRPMQLRVVQTGMRLVCPLSGVLGTKKVSWPAL